MQTMIGDYLSQQAAAGVSPRTQESSHYVLKAFGAWFGGSASQIDQRLLDNYCAHLLNEHRTSKGGKLSRASVRTYMRTLGGFVHWCQEQGEVGAKVRAKQPRKERKLVETLTRQEIDRLENAAGNIRDSLLIRVLADTGIRLGELQGLKASDLEERGPERYLSVNGKTGPRLVPVAPNLYMRLRKLAMAREGSRIFATNRRGRSGEFEPLAARSIQNMLKYTAKTAGINRRVYPHQLRHSFATWCLQRGMSPIDLQKIGGWSSLEMISSTYAHLTVSDSWRALMAIQSKSA